MEKEHITFKIRGSEYEVYRVLGAGFLEQKYRKALMHELEAQGQRTECRRALNVTHKGKPVGLYVCGAYRGGFRD